MIYLKGHLARPLDAVLSAPSRLAVLRALVRARTPLSGRALARAAGINHQGAAVALAALAKLGLVERRPAGRSDQWRLDRRRWIMSELILPLFEREAEHADAVAAAIRKALRGKAAAVLIGGAAAKGRLEPGRPVELVVVEGAIGRRPLSEALHALTTLMRIIGRWLWMSAFCPGARPCARSPSRTFGSCSLSRARRPTSRRARPPSGRRAGPGTRGTGPHRRRARRRSGRPEPRSGGRTAGAR